MFFFQNKEKKVFIRPGSEVHVGRAKECVISLSNQSVSKKHAVLTIDHISIEVALDIGAIPAVRLTDKSTGGTTVDGSHVNKASQTLRPGAIVHFGLDPEPWKLVYEPIAITLSIGLKKENVKQKLMPHAEKVGPLGFKVNAEYVSMTKLVITKKRNTGKSLQALVNGQKIASYAYIDRLVEAFPAFDGCHLPPSVEFLPTDTEDDAALFEAKAQRKTLFTGYSFIFFSSIQFANLAPCVLSGEGKAVKLEKIPGMEEIKAAAPSGETVLVLPLENSDEVLELAKQAAFATIVQNQFLGLILYCDFSTLEKQMRKDISFERVREDEGASIVPSKRSVKEELHQPLKNFKSRKLRASTVFDDIFGVQKKDVNESCRPLDGQQRIPPTITTSTQQRLEAPKEVGRESSSESDVVFTGIEDAIRLKKQARNPIFPQPTHEEIHDPPEENKPKRAVSRKDKSNAKEDSQTLVEDTKRKDSNYPPVQEYNYAEYAHLKNLGSIETFALTRSRPTRRNQRGDWNGRKNFKGFQRANGQRTVRATPHFIGFVESKSNRYDIAPSEAPAPRSGKGKRVVNRVSYAQQTLLDDYSGPVNGRREVIAVDGSNSESDEDDLRFKFD